MITFDEMAKAVAEVQSTLGIVDRLAGKMADMLVGRLRKVSSSWVLRKLKMELRDFNAHTGNWKE